MTRRSLNWKLLIASLAVCALGGAGLYALHGWQLKRLSRALLALAEEREQEEKWKEAATHLDRYLRVHRNDALGHVRLASVFAKGALTPAEKNRAVGLHYRALAANPGPEETLKLRVRLAEMLLETRRLVEAEREARQVIQDSPEHPLGHRTLALALLAQWNSGALAAGKLQDLQLLHTAERARQFNPADEALAEATATFYRQHAAVAQAEWPELTDEQRLARADACLDELVNRNPDSAAAHLARFRYRTRYALAGADGDLAAALKLAPGDEQVLGTAAMAALRQAAAAKEAGQDAELASSKYSEAQKWFEQLVAQEDESRQAGPEVFLGLGEAQHGLGELDQALQTWRDGLMRFPRPVTQISFHARMADALMQAQRHAEAGGTLSAIDDLIAQLETSVTRDERLALVQARDLRRATWHLQQGEAGTAVPLLQEVVARQASGTAGNVTAGIAWNLLGRANAEIGEWAEAAVAFDRAAPLNPTSAAARLSAAMCWLRSGRPEVAVERAEQALAIQSSVEGLLLLAAADYEWQGSLPARQSNWERLERLLGDLERNQAVLQIPSPWRVAFLRADYEAFRGRQDSDESRLQRALATIRDAEPRFERELEFWRLAALAYQRLGDRAAAEQALANFEPLCESSAERAVLRASVAAARKDWASAKQILESASAAASASDQSRLRREMVDVAMATRDLARARQLLWDEVKVWPSDVRLLRQICELELERGDLPSLETAVKRLAAAGTSGHWWARYYAAVGRYTSAKDSDDLAEALDEQAKLAVARPHWPLVYSLRGLIELRLGHLEQAAAAFEKAIQLGERRVMIFERLIALLDRLNRFDDARQYWARLGAYLPHSQRLTDIAADHELRRENPDQAIAIARAAVDQRPNDVESHLSLARLLDVTNQIAEAEGEFRKALKLAPDDVRAWTALITFFVRTGAIDKAHQAREDVQRMAHLSSAGRALSETEKKLVFAECGEIIGDYENAVKQYEAAAATAPHRADIHVRLARIHLRSDPALAEAELRKAIKAEPGYAEARRRLAVLLASRGQEADLREAQALLNQPSGPNSAVAVMDRRLSAFLLAQTPDAAQRASAAQILEEVLQTSQGSLPGDRLLLARLYESQARSTQDPAAASAKRRSAREQLLAAATQASAQPAHLAELVDFLIRHESPQSAAPWLEKLDSLLKAAAKDDAASIARFIDLLLRHGSGDRCPEWLDRLAAVDQDPSRPLLLRARWLVSQNRLGDVEAVVEERAAQILAAGNDEIQRGQLARAIGDIYVAINQQPQAQRWYRAAVHYDPAQFDSLALALASDGKTAEVVRLCQDQAARDTSARPATVLATVLTQAPAAARQNTQADAFLHAAVEKHTGDIRLLYAVATLRATQNKYDDAVKLYRQVIQLEPKNIAALNNLAMILAETPSHRSEALTLIDRAIAVAGQQPGLLDTKGAILVYLGQAQQAVPLLEAAVREAGNDPRHRFHLAAAYHGRGETTSAREQLRQALDDKLEEQVLTPTDERILRELKAALPVDHLRVPSDRREPQAP